LAEMIKTAIIGDINLFELLERNYNEIMSRDTTLLTSLVAMSVRFKAEVVSEDERETGLRRILNFGHTFGHAIEMHMSFKHGYAVASGMELAAEFSCERGFIGDAEKERIVSLLKKYNLLQTHNLPESRVEELVMHDKKKTGTDINFVFSEGIGKAFVKKVTVKELIDFYIRKRDNH